MVFSIWILNVLIFKIWKTSKNKLKKHFVSKIVLTFHCSNKLFWWYTIFCKFLAFSLNFKFFPWLLEQFFLTVGQKNFGNKIPFLLLFLWQTRASKFHFCPCTFDSFEIFFRIFPICCTFWTFWPFSSAIGVLDKDF